MPKSRITPRARRARHKTLLQKLARSKRSSRAYNAKGRRTARRWFGIGLIPKGGRPK